ncbi:hypothetical protein AVEN_119124-1 [Araneus ventricosus]|uniref:Uncharacterized protein n=1 Tax=Araneus ventricosus TaxID=182803 RepID=A0A4Y2BKZ7_ARAVE|nr:hypothetical protein AVEN_119124-1 [Araneus ventricosus]
MQVAIVYGSHNNLGRLFEISVLSNSSIRMWLTAGLDTKDSTLSTLFGPDHPGILFRKPITSIPNIDQGTVEAYEFGGKINRLNLVQSYIEYINGCINNSSGRDMNEMQCQSHHFMAQNPQWSVIEKTVTKLLDGVRKGGYLGNATEINRTADISNEQNQTLDEVEIWTFQQVVEKFSRPKELLKSLVETVYGALEYIGRIHSAEAFISAEAFTSAEAFISAVGFISAVAMIGLPAVANASGFKRSGIETPSLATIIQALFFQGRISGRSGFFYSRLQAIGMRGFLSLKEQLFVTTYYGASFIVGDVRALPEDLGCYISNMYVACAGLRINFRGSRWPSGKISALGPEGSRFETRFH